MTNIVLITNGSRPRLLEQTLRTLYDNTPVDQFNLVLVFDGLPQNGLPPNATYDNSVTVWPPCHIVGRLKNLGAYWSERQFGRGEWLCFIDDDMAFSPGWLEKIQQQIADHNQVRLLGSCRHPFHGINKVLGTYSRLDSEGPKPEDFDGSFVEVTDAVAGYCHFMRWSTWDKFGPYDAHAKGTGQSEDFALCRKIVDAGGKVGYIHPPVMAHTGLTSSEGKPILGGELIEKVEGVLYE